MLLDAVGNAGVKFVLGNDTFRAGADPDRLMSATERMVAQIKTDLEKYLGISTDSKSQYSSSSSCSVAGGVGASGGTLESVTLKLGSEEKSDAARDALQKRVDADVRKSMPGKSSEDIANEVAVRMSRIDKLRTFVMAKLGNWTEGETVTVQTHADDDKVKPSGKVLLGFLGFDGRNQVNPFTFFKTDGKGGWSEAITDGTLKGKAALSPGMQLVHEILHWRGTLVNGKEIHGYADRIDPNFSEETTVTQDVDQYLVGHPDIAPRVWYGNIGAINQLLPGKRYVLGKDGSWWLEGSNVPESKDWIRWPSESVATTGM